MANEKPSWHARLLIKAAEILGGENELRTFLRVPQSQFERWMDGRSMLPPNLFLKLVDLLSDHNEQFVSRLRSRTQQLRATHESLKKSTAALIEAGRASLAQAQEIRGWSIALRAARVCESDTAEMSRLKHRLFDSSFVPADRGELLGTALDATLAVAGTDLGNVQLVDAEGALRIEAHRGYPKPSLEFLTVVSKPECVAMSLGRQVFIPDIRRNSMFMGTDAGRALESAGCVAVTSTPLVHDTGLVIGMISTHYRKPCAEHEAALAPLELVAARTASWLDVHPG